MSDLSDFVLCPGEHELEKQKRGEVPHFAFAKRNINVQRCPCCGAEVDYSKRVDSLRPSGVGLHPDV